MWMDGAQRLRGILPTRARLHGIPDGIPGCIATLRVMRQLVLDAIRDPAQQVREAALAITTSTGYVQEVRDIQTWVQQHIRYVLDPIDSTGGVELVQTPQKTLDYAAGDCDDQATLTAALLSSIGHPTRFMAVGLNGEPFSHVLTQTKMGAGWAGVETIQAQPLGWMPSGITSHYLLKV
jgi:transglutaminase-like putative cysteine protease